MSLMRPKVVKKKVWFEWGSNTYAFMDNRPSANLNDALVFDRQCLYKKFRGKILP